MKLIDILAQELPERGGWIKGHYQCAQDKSGEVCFYTKGKIHITQYGLWSISVGSDAKHDGFSRVVITLADDYAETIITREQYESALAASTPEWDGEGLPPVGCECEYETNFDGWQSVRIELIKSEGIAFTWLANSQAYNGLDCVGVQKSGSFRPKRTEAERKRDEAVRDFVRQLIECVDFHAGDKRNIDIVRAKLYSMLPTLPGVTVID